ncbi:MAG: ABC transporter six-transmembrane domain-containing protein, partial [Chromatiales bacterium]|nr:ABC transporter six-transmembrane domain-containing protein [Chromatiales bacterium]
IYRDMATTLVEQKRGNGVATTTLTAQVNLLYEIVEFFENSLPSLIGAAIAFFGVTVMLGLIDLWVMASCLLASVLVILIYALSEKRIFAYNKHQNDELEKQVDVLKENRRRRVHVHFGRIMKWNIKLSDLETLNYSGVWVVMALMLILSIILVVGNTEISYGQKITSIMYVFEYIEVVMSFPLFYQEIIRLQEITGRLSQPATSQ